MRSQTSVTPGQRFTFQKASRGNYDPQRRQERCARLGRGRGTFETRASEAELMLWKRARADSSGGRGAYVRRGQCRCQRYPLTRSATPPRRTPRSTPSSRCCERSAGCRSAAARGTRPRSGGSSSSGRPTWRSAGRTPTAGRLTTSTGPGAAEGARLARCPAVRADPPRAGVRAGRQDRRPLPRADLGPDGQALEVDPGHPRARPRGHGAARSAEGGDRQRLDDATSSRRSRARPPC